MNSIPILFNRKILDEYLSAFDAGQIEGYENKREEMSKWKKSIESSDLQRTKETSVQGNFFSSVFEKILGYKIMVGNDEWNQIQELKSKLDSSEADGALGFFTATDKIVRAAIELKDANTNLDKKQHRSNNQTPVEQAFGYAHKNGSGCSWVIVSNFVEVRLYKSSSSLEYEKFLITDLDDEYEFKRFYFLLCKANLIEKSGKSVVDKIYDENEQARMEISNEFYRDYKKLRGDLFEALKEHNPQADEMTLFSKAQKILDRFIFVCFCESRRLLPKDVIKEVIETTKKLNSLVKEKILLWTSLKEFFRSIDQGNPPRINGYNGGLFMRDDVLDALAIPDGVLEQFAKLTEYDFDSELNVNILGHIFEQSISDLEQFKAELAGTPVDRRSSRQRADGIFYTPEYVTKFIVEKTIGRWCDDQKEQIKRELIGHGGYAATIGKRKITLTRWEELPEEETAENYQAIVNLHDDFWERYANRLETIRVLDPACGSGAFLNAAFDFLYQEGTYASEMGKPRMMNWNKGILQKNLFGVDLNTESVEITKLSLWLKTAKSDEELASLDENIKSGNSIINDAEISGERAFDWSAEFAEVMEQGGFDVVIGNPPYGAALTQAEKDYITANYQTTEYNFDTYKTFMELGLNLTKQDGYMGYITPNTFFVLEKGANKLRKFLFENHILLDIVELFNVFPAAVVEPAITVFKNSKPSDCDKLEVISVPRKTDLASTFITDGVRTAFEQKDLREKEGYIFNFRETETKKQLAGNIKQQGVPLGELFHVSAGVKPYEKGKGIPAQTAEILRDKPFESYEKHDEDWRPLIRGQAIDKYTDKWNGEYIKYGEWLAAPRSPKLFEGEKLFIRRTSDYLLATYFTNGKVGNNSVHCVYNKQENTSLHVKYLLGLINSTLMNWIYQHENFHMVGKPFAEVKVAFVERLPIVVADDQSQVIALVDKLLENCQARFDKAKQFTDYLTAMYAPKSVSERLTEFYKLDFRGFVDELKKQKVKLTPAQEMELMPLFQEKARELVELSRTVERLDMELDEVVFALYGLTEDERAIVEGNI